MEVRLTSAWEAILTADKIDDASRDCPGGVELQAELGAILEDEDNSIVTDLKQVIADELKAQGANAPAAILKHFEEAVEQLFRAFNL